MPRKEGLGSVVLRRSVQRLRAVRGNAIHKSCRWFWRIFPNIFTKTPWNWNVLIPIKFLWGIKREWNRTKAFCFRNGYLFEFILYSKKLASTAFLVLHSCCMAELQNNLWITCGTNCKSWRTWVVFPLSSSSVWAEGGQFVYSLTCRGFNVWKIA